MIIFAASIICVLLAFVVACVLTAVVRAVARRYDWTAKPRADRWHTQPTALFGGVAIFLTVALVYATALPKTEASIYVLAGSAFLWLVGLIDDSRNLKPYQKVIGQVMGSAIIISGGLLLPWTPWTLVNMAVTIVWLVAITNAVNILDNMDGLAAGVSLIATVFLAIHFADNGLTQECLLLAVFAAALLGFLIFNTNPASIFMGDCGSLFIGFFLAAASLLDLSQGRTRSFLPVLAVPFLILCIPIFDITLVTLARKMSGRAASQGGRDHTSHRLVALGLSERRTVTLLYSLATLSGLLSLAVLDWPLDISLAAVASFTLVLTVLGVYLAGVKVYSEEEVRNAQQQPIVAFLVDLSYKRRIFEVLLDAALIILSYYTAYGLFFGPVWGHSAWQQFVETAPILVFVKLPIFLLGGLYRGLWRYVSLDNLWQYAKAVVISSVCSVLVIVVLYRFEGFSRSVFVLDALLLLVLVCSARITFRMLRNLLPVQPRGSGQRVLIYGAGDAGELLVRELRNNPGHACQPVGFLDDDPLKKGKIIHGLRVHGGNGAFLRICRQQHVNDVVISSGRFDQRRIQEILKTCNEASITVRCMRIHIEQLSSEKEYASE